MEEQIISFETAKLAKEKGFEWNCNDCYDRNGHTYLNGWCERLDDFFEDNNFNNSEIESKGLEYYYIASTQSLLQKWLREVYNIIVTSYPITGFDKIEYSYNIYTFSNILSLTETTARRFNTDEKSLEEVLQKGLKLILKIDKNDNSKR